MQILWKSIRFISDMQTLRSNLITKTCIIWQLSLEKR